MNLTTTKIIVAILLGFLRFFFGVLPVKIYKILRHWEGSSAEDASNTFFNQKRHNQVNMAMALCQSFGGGVLLATCFLHMMLDVHKSVEELKKYGDITTEYPLSQLIVCLGFFFVYFLEEISHWFITSIPATPCKKKIREVTPISNKVAPFEKIEEPKTKEVFIIEENLKEIEANNELKDIEMDIDEFSITSTVQKENEKNLDPLDEEEEEPVDSEVLKHEKTQQQIVRFCLVVIALSFHATFEGLAIGIQNNTANIWYLFTAVLIHSTTILFCIGLEMLLAQSTHFKIYVQMLILALASPLGVVLGLLITIRSDMNTKAKSTAVVFLEGLSTGAIIYITFFEVLNREKARRVLRLTRAICILAGFALMALIQFIETQSEY